MLRSTQIVVRSVLAIATGVTVAGCGDDVKNTKIETDAGGGAECVVTSDCPTGTPTVECNAGICEDPEWGCVGQGDERPPAMSGTATFSVRLMDVGSEGPVGGTVNVRACNLPTAASTECTVIAGTTSTHNPADGVITVTGLPQDQPFRLAIDFADTTRVPIDFYVQRPPRGTERDTYPLTTLTKGLITQLATVFGVPVNPEAGTMLASFNNCLPTRGEPIETDRLGNGVKLNLAPSEVAPDTRMLYLGTDRVPNPTLTATTALSGSVSVMNLVSGKPFTLKGTVGNVQLPTMQVVPIRDRLVIALLYPRTYTK